MSKYIFCPQFDTFLPEAKEESQTREIDRLTKKKEALTNVTKEKIIPYIETTLVGKYNHISFNGTTEYKLSDNTFNIFISKIKAIYALYEGPTPTDHTYANKKKFLSAVNNWADGNVDLMKVEGEFIERISASILKEYVPTCLNQITGASATQLQDFHNRIYKYYTVQFLKTKVKYRRTKPLPVCRPRTLKKYEFKFKAAFDFGTFKKEFENKNKNTNQRGICKKFAEELTEHCERLWKRSEHYTLPIQQPEIFYSDIDRTIPPIVHKYNNGTNEFEYNSGYGTNTIRTNYEGQHGVSNYSYERDGLR